MNDFATSLAYSTVCSFQACVFLRKNFLNPEHSHHATVLLTGFYVCIEGTTGIVSIKTQHSAKEQCTAYYIVLNGKVRYRRLTYSFFLKELLWNATILTVHSKWWKNDGCFCIRSMNFSRTKSEFKKSSETQDLDNHARTDALKEKYAVFQDWN